MESAYQAANRVDSPGPNQIKPACCETGGMGAAAVVLIVMLAVPLVIVGILFVWAAIRDGEEDRAVQRRLGIRRKTRLGR